MKKKTIGKRILKIAAVIAINLVVIAVIVELFAWFVMIDSWPTYFLKHNYPGVEVKTTSGPVSGSWTTNSMGFHDKDRDFEKEKGEYRVVAIGDSFLDGPHSEPLPMRLEQTPGFRDKQISVVNMSRGGIDPHQYYMLFKYAVAEYNPDMIVVFIYEGNDFRRMETLKPELYDEPQRFFERYPTCSYYGKLFPRTTVFFSDLRKKKFVHKWSDVSKYHRYRLQPLRDLTEISREMSKYIKKPAPEIKSYLDNVLLPSEIEELQRYPVRLDVFSYLAGIGSGAEFTKRLYVKGRRPEINNKQVAASQVRAVARFLDAMKQTCQKEKILFKVVLIPTSYIDPSCSDLYARMGAGNDPLFVGTRQIQTAQLKRNLKESNTDVLDLNECLGGVPGTYLKFDTHWSIKGVELVAEYLEKVLIPEIQLH
ncbi:MAG: SGNH/GDSL hydrolase family protein [bacterium]|nr:SGNH/GDSL hydrolase family protein [bacterium]